MGLIAALKFRKIEKEVTKRGNSYKLVFSLRNLYNCERKKSFR